MRRHSGESPIVCVTAPSQISPGVIGVTDLCGAFPEAAGWAPPGLLVTEMLAKRPADDNADRYVARPTGSAWCVWDTRRDAVVFGAERMEEGQARALACRLSEAYRRTGSGGARSDCSR
jgi:hypothetical protein